MSLKAYQATQAATEDPRAWADCPGVRCSNLPAGD